MQQTEKYKLNLIEMSDTFSPEPLNENMEALEAALDAEAAARKSGDSAMSSRVTTLEARKIATGTYTGNGTADQTIYIGFTPKVVMIQPGIDNGLYLGITGGSSYITPVSGGFKLTESHVRVNGRPYYYCAIS